MNNSFNVCLVGPVGSGKTSMLNAFFGQEFNVNVYTPTMQPVIRHAIIETTEGPIHIRFEDYPGGMNADSTIWHGAIAVRDFHDEDIWTFRDGVVGITAKSKADNGKDDMRKYIDFNGQKCSISARSKYCITEPFQYLLRKLTKTDVCILHSPIVEIVFTSYTSDHGAQRAIKHIIEDVRIHKDPTDAIWRDILAKYEAITATYRGTPSGRVILTCKMPCLPCPEGFSAPAIGSVNSNPISKEVWENIAKEFQTVTNTSNDNLEKTVGEISQEFDYESEIRRIELAEALLEGKCAAIWERQKKISEEIASLHKESQGLDVALLAVQNETSDLWEANPKVTEFRQLYNDVVGTDHEKLKVSDEVKNAVRKALQKQLPTAMFDTKVRLETAIWGLDHSSSITIGTSGGN